MSTRLAMLLLLALSVLLPGSGGGLDSVKPSCPATRERSPSSFNYGNRSLRVALWPDGRLVAGKRSDGSSYAEIKPDGSIEAKLGWWRAVAGRLRIEGETLDAPAVRLGAHVPAGYGDTGFQPTGVVFPTAACWRVVGKVGDAHVAFIVLVTKR